MITYKKKKLSILFDFFGFLLVMSILSVSFILAENIPVFIFFLIPLVLAISLGGLQITITKKVEIFDDRIAQSYKLYHIDCNDFLFWKEVENITSNYILFPEMTGWISINPTRGSKSKSLVIYIDRFSLNLLKDILEKIPSNTKVELYPWLERKIKKGQTEFRQGKKGGQSHLN